MGIGWYLPLLTFVALALAERACGAGPRARLSAADHGLNLAGLAIQGTAVPVLAYLIATKGLAARWPHLQGLLPLGWWGAFALNFVAVDALYYAQHRAFHRFGALWALHRCHHAAPTVDVWTTARNSLWIHFLFVYLLVNPVLGFLCDAPEGFFFGAALTASLDLWRHSRLPQGRATAWLGRVLVTPAHHHLHHSPEGAAVNFGANLMLWDRLFGTAREPRGYPARYGVPGGAAGLWRQFILLR